jgi:hypothetical protein
MMNPMDYPFLVLVTSFVVMLVPAWLGDWLRKRRRNVDDAQREDMKMVLNAVLILMALLIGFTFSMAVSRYDQRKKLEEEEANAIGTEYLRTDLMSAANAAEAQRQLKKYTDERIRFYSAPNSQAAASVRAGTAEVEERLWAAVLAERAHDTPVTALVFSGMNDVINSEGYTQAAYLDRIPNPAWGLMIVIALYCNLLIGFSESRTEMRALLVFPVVVSIAFYLIAEIDSPHGGMIRVVPYNLVSLSQSMLPK